MLPEFPIAQETIQDAWNKKFFQAVGCSNPVTSRIQIRVQKEGNRTIVGSSEIEFQRASVLHEAKSMSGIGIPFDEFFALAEKLGSEMAHEQAKHIYTVMAAPGPANAVIEWKGDGFSFEQFMSALEGMEVEFDGSGAPQWPTFFLPPSAATEMEKRRKIWDADSYCRNRLAELITKKRKEFDEREARRRLVD